MESHKFSACIFFTKVVDQTIINLVVPFALRTHFEEYGEIEEIAFPINKEKKIRKGFCFVTFKDANACELATAKGKEKQDLGGKKVGACP